MKNTLSIVAIICTVVFTSCTETLPCDVPTNGFLTGTDYQVKMGSAAAVDVFNQLDAAWANRDYETMKTFIADKASLSFEDGFVATTPQEFVDKIKTDAEASETEGNNQWVTNYAFALTLTDDGSEETTMDAGDWVNAQFTKKLQIQIQKSIQRFITNIITLLTEKLHNGISLKKLSKNKLLTLIKYNYYEKFYDRLIFNSRICSDCTSR